MSFMCHMNFARNDLCLINERQSKPYFLEHEESLLTALKGQTRQLRFRYVSVLRRDFQAHCLLRKSVRSGMTVHSRVGSAHWHSRYREQRGSPGSTLVP